MKRACSSIERDNPTIDLIKPPPLLYRFPSCDAFLSRSASDETPVIEEIKTFCAITRFLSSKPLVILDLDNTVFEPAINSQRQLLGSPQWFDAHRSSLELTVGNLDRALRIAMGLYDFIQHYIAVKPVEPKTPFFIRNMQDNGIPVLALTARGGNLVDITQQQLESIGVSFKHRTLAQTCGEVFDRIFMLPHPEEFSNRPAIATKGMVFCSGQDKGQCLKFYLDKLRLQPSQILFVDDKEKCLEQVKNMCALNKISFRGLHYTYLADQLMVDLNRAAKELQDLHRSQAQIKTRPGSLAITDQALSSLLPAKRSRLA